MDPPAVGKGTNENARKENAGKENAGKERLRPPGRIRERTKSESSLPRPEGFSAIPTSAPRRHHERARTDMRQLEAVYETDMDEEKRFTFTTEENRGFKKTLNELQEGLESNVVYRQQSLPFLVTERFVHFVFRFDQPNRKRLYHKSTFFSHFIPEEQSTYINLLITKFKKLFLICVCIGLPGYIFTAIDQFLVDKSLPFSKEDLAAIPEATIGFRRAFYKEQWRWVIRGLELGGHIDYTTEEQTQFLFEKDIGRGSGGQVRVIKCRITGNRYCDKILFNMPTSGTCREVDTIKELSHMHIVTIFATYVQKNAFHILMTPICDGNLSEFLKSSTSGQFATIRPEDRPFLYVNWLNCLTSAIKYLHDERVLHRDIKPDNILIKSRQIFLTDLGISAKRTENEESGSVHTSHPGTEIYGAPEQQWAGYPTTVGRKADIFALGCIFAEIAAVSGGKTFNQFRKARRMPHGRGHNGLPDYSYCNNLGRAKDFLQTLYRTQEMSLGILPIINDCWEVKPENRPNGRQIMTRLLALQKEHFPKDVFCCVVPSSPKGKHSRKGPEGEEASDNEDDDEVEVGFHCSSKSVLWPWMVSTEGTKK